MPIGSISSSPDHVGVAVCNYTVPVCETHEEVIANCHKVAATIKGAKRGYPGLDLIVFPEYTTQGKATLANIIEYCCFFSSKQVPSMPCGPCVHTPTSFPAFSLGFHPTKWNDFTTTLDGPEVAIFKEACIENGVFGIFSITGEKHPEGKNPYNTLIMINDKGDIVLTYRKIVPW